MKPEKLYVNIDGEEVEYDNADLKTKITVTVDPDEVDDLVASDLRRCYVDAKMFWDHDKAYNERLCDAILTVLEHYMIQADFEAWYETIREL